MGKIVDQWRKSLPLGYFIGMGQGLSQGKFKKKGAPKTKNLLLIFTRNPVLGKCKTRLAATVGNQTALGYLPISPKTYPKHLHKVYRLDKRVYYSEEIWEEDIWDHKIFEKYLQQGADLGERMANAFKQGFRDGYTNIVIIGSDMFDLQTADLQEAFNALNNHDFVLGPAVRRGLLSFGNGHF